MNNSKLDFSQFNGIRKSFPCPRCKARGNTLVERETKFVCYRCGFDANLRFWHRRFAKLKPELTFREASVAIGAGLSGSTFRRAKSEGRLTTSGRVGAKANLIAREELVRFYLTHFKHKDMKRENGKSKE